VTARSAVVYRNKESRNRYIVLDNVVKVEYTLRPDKPLEMHFHTVAEARQYAASHGEMVR
jgi:hypothetical protein